jgi:hypothetical protein
MGLRRSVWIIPAGLAAAGVVAMLVATGGAGWPLAAGWIVVAAAVAWFEYAAHTKRARVFLPSVAILALPILAFEGGFFMLPAAVGLIAAAAVNPEPSPRRRIRTP